MKNLILTAIMLMTTISFAQKERSLELNNATDLIDVVYYHDNGTVSQTGSYTKDGKLHGEWLSFCKEGNKIVSAKYNNGKKVGKWFYWNGNSLTEVDYSNNDIANVSQWTSSESLASN